MEARRGAHLLHSYPAGYMSILPSFSSGWPGMGVVVGRPSSGTARGEADETERRGGSPGGGRYCGWASLGGVDRGRGGGAACDGGGCGGGEYRRCVWDGWRGGGGRCGGGASVRADAGADAADVLEDAVDGWRGGTSPRGEESPPACAPGNSCHPAGFGSGFVGAPPPAS